MVYLVPGTGFVEARAAGGFMPGFGRQVGGVQVTPSRDGPVAAEPKTPATAGSPPVTPASQIIPSFSNMSLEEAETKEDDKKTLNYLLRAPTLRLDDTHVDPTQKDNDTEAATQKTWLMFNLSTRPHTNLTINLVCQTLKVHGQKTQNALNLHLTKPKSLCLLPCPWQQAPVWLLPQQQARAVAQLIPAWGMGPHSCKAKGVGEGAQRRISTVMARTGSF
jgi:hypothetical protein